MTYKKSYSELIAIDSYEDRFRYLMLNGKIGETTFGSDRYLNQVFYKSPEWISAKQDAIIRDNGCDMAFSGYEIHGCIIIVHHINPITIDDIRKRSPKLFDLENLITVAHNTHNAIHYGNESFLFGQTIVERKPNDTCPWKGGVTHGR